MVNCYTRQHVKNQRHYFVHKGPSSQGYGFSSGHVWMWEWDYKESWAQKNWCFWTVVLEKTLESPLDRKEIQPVHSKGDQSWAFIERTDVEAETPILWPPDMKNWLTGKDPDAGKDWGQEERGTTEDDMVGWHPWLNGHGFRWTPGVGDGQRGLACCGSWGRKESDTTERLNCTMLCWFLWYNSVNQLYVYIYSLLIKSSSHPLLPSLQVITELSSLCYTAASHYLPILHMAVYLCQLYSLDSSHPPHPLLCSQVHPVHLHFYSFPEYRCICTMFFRFHAYVLINDLNEDYFSCPQV